MAAGPAMALFSRTPGGACTGPTRGPHGAAAGMAVAAPKGGPPDGSGSSVGIRIIGELEGGKHPRVVMFCTKICITVDAGTLVRAFESGCDAVAFFFSSYLIIAIFSLFFFSSTSRWYAVSSVPVATRKYGNLDISYPVTYIRTGTLISPLFLV